MSFLGDDIDEWTIEDLKAVVKKFQDSHKSTRADPGVDYLNTELDLFADLDKVGINLNNYNIFKDKTETNKHDRSKGRVRVGKSGEQGTTAQLSVQRGETGPNDGVGNVLVRGVGNNLENSTGKRK